MSRRTNLYASALFVLSSVLYFGIYTRGYNDEEVELLRSTADYIEDYDGEDANAAFDRINSTLDEVTGSNHSLIRQANQLERYVSYVECEVRPTESYEPVLNYVGRTLENLAQNFEQDSNDLWLGFACGLLALSFVTTREYENES